MGNPLCVVCRTKPARIGKKTGGYPANLVCSHKCALNFLLEHVMDYKLCSICKEWEEVCGGHDEPYEPTTHFDGTTGKAVKRI